MRVGVERCSAANAPASMRERLAARLVVAPSPRWKVRPRAVKGGTIASWRASSRGWLGRPRRSRYSGAAQVMTSERASRRATKLAVERLAATDQDRDVVVLVDRLDRPGRGELERHPRVLRTEARQVLGELVHGEGRRREHAQVAARLGVDDELASASASSTSVRMCRTRSR